MKIKTKFMSKTLCLFLTLGCFLNGQSVLASTIKGKNPNTADLILKNGNIYTMNDNSKAANAIAIKNKRIIYVGNNEDADKYINANTKVVDLQNKTVLPAFHDTHIHTLETGIISQICNLESKESIDEYITIIKKYIEENPEKQYIEGFGFLTTLMNDGKSKKEILDAISSEKPIFIMADDGHSAWVNSKALELAKIDKNTPNPSNGIIGKDATTGELTGMLYEESAMNMVHKIQPSLDVLRNGLNNMIGLLNSQGITSYVDARVNKEQLAAYKHIHNESRLNARAQLALHLNPETADKDMAYLEKVLRVKPNANLQSNQVKIFMDGVVENQTANLLEPYKGTSSHGTEIFDLEKLKKYAVKLDNIGYQLHFHAMGDKAVKQALDVLETVENTNGKKDRRPILAHLGLVAEEDKQRMKNLGAIPSLSFTWESPVIAETEKLLGTERYLKSYPSKSLIDAGINIAAGSDFAANEYISPFMGIQVAVTRQQPTESGEDEGTPILNPNERLTVEQAVKAYTTGAAYAMHLENKTGSIEVGKQADIIVLDQDIFKVSPYKIGATNVLWTLFQGKVVHGNPDFK